jgi:hypothetical protein
VGGLFHCSLGGWASVLIGQSQKLEPLLGHTHPSLLLDRIR